ncbi:MAG: hypothetical protein E6Q97_08225 [Desulfurellales bacterium]|nr:MAG: hypothetical protein E6Q97_08225 [Desulfurellales bacterium]
MATTTSKLDAAINWLADTLAARAGLAGVQIATGWLGGDTSGRESIQILDGLANQSWGGIGRLSREEELELRLVIFVKRPGGNDSIIRTTRARAFELLAEIEDAIRATAAAVSFGGLLRKSQITQIELEQGANPNERWAQLNVTIEADKRLVST